MYKLTVTKYEKNENYEDEMKTYDGRWSNKPAPAFERVIDVLTATLTEEEYKAVKKAVIEVK